ncbi:hypothetical protein DDE01_16570 [Desulfovibrio desulfuricans]|nr:hypothetical protein DDE01_16570 [Desulfovibrio desulfuricans]
MAASRAKPMMRETSVVPAIRAAPRIDEVMPAASSVHTRSGRGARGPPSPRAQPGLPPRAKGRSLSG